MSEAFDFNALVPPADGRDATLLAHLARLDEIRRQIDTAQRRGETAGLKSMKSFSAEYLSLDNSVRDTPALTAPGRYAKATYALREVDPDKPEFSCWNHHAASALWDIIQAGQL